VTFSDTNFASYSMKLTRTRNGEKDVDVTRQFMKNLKVGGNGGSGVFDTFDKIPENDGIYTLTVKMYDLAGNEAETVTQYTLNRFGSVYVYGNYLNRIQDQFVQNVTDDITIKEINPNKLKDGQTRVEITRDGTPIGNVSYKINPEDSRNIGTGESGWYEYVYTIAASNFTEDGVYRVTVISSDEAGNSPETSTVDGGIIFRVDHTAPEITSVVGLEKYIVNASSQDIDFMVFDALGLAKIDVYVDGTLVLEADSFDDLNNYRNLITLGEGMNQNVRIVATDIAGNSTDTEHVDEESKYTFEPSYDFVHNITVSTNIFIRWYANTVLFWGSLIAAAAVLILFFILWKRRKDKEEEQAA